MLKNKETARQVASRDITEDCKKMKDGQNYLSFEKDICESLGIPTPDFRQFNGGKMDKAKAYGEVKEKPKTCRHCKHRLRWSYGGSVIQYCEMWESKRTSNGLRKIKVTNPACVFYEEENNTNPPQLTEY